MSLVRFVVAKRELLTESRLARSYVTGSDEVASFCRAYLTDDYLIVESNDDGSLCFALPWPLPEMGDWMVSTSTLMNRERPYLLEVELARGIVFRLRDQMALWEHMGLRIPDELRELVALATQHFSRAATHQDDPNAAAEHALQAIHVAAGACTQLSQVYTDQAIKIRRNQTEKLTTLMATRLPPKVPRGVIASEIKETFNMAAVSCSWGDLELSEAKYNWSVSDLPIRWAATEGLRIACGPLLEFDDQLVPDWAFLWEGDFETLSSLMLSHVENVVKRYRGKVQLWNVASKINRSGVLSLSDEQRLQIVATAVNMVRNLDPQTPIVVGIDQPWGEYRSRKETDLMPIDFADALERNDLGIAGFNLELNIGYEELSTALRNPLAMSRLVDIWSVRLETPLMVSIRLPSSSEERADAAKTKISVCEETPDLVSPDWQAKWVGERVPLLIAKGAVQILVWDQLDDKHAKQWPHSGLFDIEGNPKPLVNVLKDLRKEYLE